MMRLEKEIMVDMEAFFRDRQPDPGE
jgi:hypothetical protein